MAGTSNMPLGVKIVGGYALAAALLYAIGQNKTASNWFGQAIALLVLVMVLAVVWTVLKESAPALKAWVVQPTFTAPKTIFMIVIGLLLFWMLLAPGGFLTCRPTATGNAIVDYLCEPMYDSANPRESEEARRKFWAGRPQR